MPWAGTLVSVAPATYRQTALRLHDAQPPGYLIEPATFLHNAPAGDGWATHSVAVSGAGAVLAY
ncbi:hypothetical protein [Winogradskya humida]|uniref:Uncharacterized protein n=1 Tax=Winogradskya humida TaxID=113566 RepID=A0ABQ3ZVS9_9ACTN|nr:hypothetical protein [Actinoplanes humidus]GIE22553.1 hypothetical protein Ahu01nite_056550 [Actinoplanes humidus]